ncbi:hypothetical protein ACQUE8_17915, partial [Enterococcus casseliflavus]
MMKQTQIDTPYPSEKIRTGQSFLYRKNGVESMIIDIQLHETVRGDYLIRAADKACQRYAYLTQQLVECDGDFYLVENKQPLVVRHSSSFLPLGSDAVNGHLFDLHYDSKTIGMATVFLTNFIRCRTSFRMLFRLSLTMSLLGCDDLRQELTV